MSALPDHVITSLAKEGRLISENFSQFSVTPNGYDLRIGTLKHFNSESEVRETLIQPGQGIWVSTMEYLEMPRGVMGQIWLRSSYARRGIIGSFGAVESGFSGNLTLSLFNFGLSAIDLKSGERIAQIVFHSLVSEPEHGYAERSGTYSGSRGVNTGPLVK